jgi:hypothetical protein
VRRDGRDAMAAEMASGEGGGGLRPRPRRKRCGVRRDRVENGMWPEMDAGAAVERRRRRRSVAIGKARNGYFSQADDRSHRTSGPKGLDQTAPTHRHTATEQ